MNYGEIAKDRGNLAQAYCIQDKHRSEVRPTLHVNKRPVVCTSCWFILTRRCSVISLLYLSLLVKHLLDINHCHPCWCNPIRGCVTPIIVAFFVDLLLKECHTTYIAMDQPWYPTVHIETNPIGLLYWCSSHHSYGKSQVLQAETQEFDRIWVVCISGK